MGDVIVLLTLLVGTFVVAFCAPAFLDKPKKLVKRTFAEKLAVQVDMLKLERSAKEDIWIESLQAGIKELNYDLLVLRGEPDITVQNMAAQKMALDAIEKAEECLGMLLKRRDNSASA